MRFYKPISLAIGILFSVNSYADGILEDEPYLIGWSKVITLSAGPAWAWPGDDQTLGRLYVYPVNFDEVHRFRGSKDASTLGTGEVFLALQHQTGPNMIGRLGLAFAGSSQVEVKGTMDLVGVPSVANYSYHINHTRVAIKGLLATENPGYYVQPYLSGSFGIGFNHAYSFQTQPPVYLLNPGVALLQLGYQSNTTQGFSFTLGAGVQKSLSRHWQVGLGYEFADWGKSRLNNEMPDPWGYGYPKLSNLYTHELQFSLSFIC
ncbi:hypothetical protein B1207_02115 [Legionella quinlivanii]|uniref:Uncharacterized protein n=1 Tax=Legionella quinlivanii TaxID=45073 RepID=A0A364LLQ9_9GAMM|nr:outer membrane beta-barrel protein [Legionella quinlivanii]RAP37809.1 hypothetical protein B1207_02115 [Legionella quinlivanii]